MTCVANGREALFRVLDRLPDVVLLDLLMPVMDGASFLEVVRSYVRLKALPVIVLTSLSVDPMIDRVQALHANSILAKDKSSLAEIRLAVETAIGFGTRA